MIFIVEVRIELDDVGMVKVVEGFDLICELILHLVLLDG